MALEFSIAVEKWVEKAKEQGDTAFQATAAKVEDFKTVSNALVEFKTETLKTALRLLESETVFRSEKFLGPVRWLLTLREAWSPANPSKQCDNIVWRAVAKAPDGFCHPKSSVVGSLLEDIAMGKSLPTVKRNFEAKLDPTKYQRPVAAPTVQNIQRAEKLIDALGLEPALKRRFARLDDLKTIWKPRSVSQRRTSSTDGVFSHVVSKGSRSTITQPSGLPRQTMTWEKFGWRA